MRLKGDGRFVFKTRSTAVVLAVCLMASGFVLNSSATLAAPNSTPIAQAAVSSKVIKLVSGKTRVRVDFPKTLRGKTVTIRISRLVEGQRKFFTLGKITLDRDGKGVLTLNRKIRLGDRLIVKDGQKRIYNVKVEVIDDRTLVIPAPTPTPTPAPNLNPAPAPIIGTNSDDELIGGSGNDTILGGQGSDILIGGDGNNVLFGNNSDNDEQIDRTIAIDTAKYLTSVTVTWDGGRGVWKVRHSGFTDTLYGIEKVESIDQVIWLVDQDPLQGSNSFIQTAIDSASTGETVLIAEGTFAEELHVRTANLSILGSGQEKTFIVPSRNYAIDNRGVSIYNVGELQFADFTVDGSGNPSLASGENFQDGIWWQGGGNNVTIERVTVQNIDRRAISVFPESVVGTLISYVTVDNVTGVKSGFREDGSLTGQGFEGIKMNGTGTVEYSRVTRTLNSINGTVNVPDPSTVNLINNVVTDIRPGRSTGDRFTIGINFWLQTKNRVNVIGNSITGTVDGGSGIYLVQPGAGSLVTENNITFSGARGIGIETGWSSANGLTISDNSITMGKASTGLLLTGSGISSDRVLIKDNIISNSSTEGQQVNDLRRDGFSTSREVGILLSSDKVTSRTGDAGGALYATLTGNSVSGFTNAVVGLKGTSVFDAQLTENSLIGVGTALLYGTLTGATFVAAPEDGALARWLVPGNWWGTSDVIANQISSGWVSLRPWCLTVDCSALSTE